MHLQASDCIDAEPSRPVCSAIQARVFGKEEQEQEQEQEQSGTVRGSSMAWQGMAWAVQTRRAPLVKTSSSEVYLFPADNDTAGSTQARGSGLERSFFQHVWHCLIYSGVYLFQFARHMALLLRTSSALPAHHCIRQASHRHGWLPRAFLALPSHCARCSLIQYGQIFDDQSRSLFSHCLCIEWLTDFVSICDRLIQRQTRRSSPCSYAQRNRCSAGQRWHSIYPAL
jgi:hypothetical protein